jgi:Carboxypeptidase regulatory-like domain
MLALASAFGGQGFVAPVHAQTGWQASEDDALLFDVRLGKYRLGDGVRGYQTPEGSCVDFADTIMALDIPVRLDKKLGRATGWAFDENHTISVDREANKVQIVNVVSHLKAGEIYDTPEGWCVRVESLAGWLGITLTADNRNAILKIEADRKLPPELAAERKDRAARIRNVSNFDLKSLPQASFPFRGVKPPSMDANINLSARHNANGDTRFSGSYQLYFAGEIGPLGYDARLGSDARGVPTNLRVSAYRQSKEPTLLGPLKATQFALGDVNGFATPLVSRSTAGRGARVSNRPLQRPDRFSSTDFRGELPAGWDAELYRNGELLSFAIDQADGRYEFLDVPLLYGDNRFEVVLYGPQGQIKREKLSQRVGPESIPPKTGYYWGAIVQDGKDFLTLGDSFSRGTGQWRGGVGYERGLDDKTSVAFSLQSLNINKVGRRNFAETAVRRSFGPGLVELTGGWSSGGGYVVQTELLAQWGQTFITADTSFGNGRFASDRQSEGRLRSHALSLDRSVSLGRLVLPVHVGGSYAVKVGGASSFGLDARTSVRMFGYSVTGQVIWARDRSPTGPDPPQRIDANLLLNGRIGRVRVRGEAEFGFGERKGLRRTTLTGEWTGKGGGDRPPSWRLELGYEKFSRRGSAEIGYVRRFDRFSVIGRVEGATDGSVSAGINLAFSLGPDPRDGRSIRMTSARLAAQGQVMARVFNDLNGDGIRQDGEPLEKEVQLTAGRRPARDLTNSKGEVIMDELAPYEPILVGIDASSLPDPLIQPSGPGKVVTPRPGVIARVDLPLSAAGEVDGTLINPGGGGMEGVDLELTDTKGNVVARTRSDFDGFFLFEKVPYGQYALRVASLSAQAAGLMTDLGQVVVVDGQTPVPHLGPVTANRSGQRNAATPVPNQAK